MNSEPKATMAEAAITEEMIEAMAERVGVELRIDHSVNNEDATRMAVLRFVGGIGDTNRLWSDPEYAADSPYGSPVAPPSFVIACFSGIQFGWPGLGSFHSSSHVNFERPIRWGDHVDASCVYEGFDGPSPSTFAGQTMTDRFRNSYTNQDGEVISTIRWRVINFERGSAQERRDANGSGPVTMHQWDEAKLAEIEARVLAERPRGAKPRYWEEVEVGEALDTTTKGPIGFTDEIAFVAGGGTPIPRLKAHAAALHDYAEHPAWAFRDPVTSAREPIYAVHYNAQAAQAMGVSAPYDVGFQRQCWQIHHLTDWCGDHAWLKECQAEYRRFVMLSDVVVLEGEVVDKRIDEDGEHVVEVRTKATNQRDEVVMPGSAVIALPSRDEDTCPAERRAHRPGEAYR